VQRTLVDLAMSGDEEAFARLAGASADRLMAIAYRILRDAGRAEDAVQQTLVTAWRQLPKLRDPDRFDAWLHRLVVNACYAEARAAHRWAGNIRALPVDPPSWRDDYAGVSQRDQLDRGFSRLPVNQRAIVVLHYYVGLSLAEIGDQLGLPVGTVKSRLHYAIAALRASLDADARTSQSSERPA
jgi:RNA polymerase sigma-70 factor (ECF subfamily)